MLFSRARATLVVAGLATLLVLPPTAANAAASSSETGGTGVVTSHHVTPPAGAVRMKMTLAGRVDADVATAHGFRVVTDSDGSQHSVPTSAAKNPDGTPYSSRVHRMNVIEGDCGDAFLWVYPVGGHVAEIVTGFDLYDDAVALYWRVRRHDSHGSGTYSWATGLFDTSWEGEWDVHVGSQPLTEYASVIAGTSDAILWDGDVCTAGPASDSDWIF